MSLVDSLHALVQRYASLTATVFHAGMGTARSCPGERTQKSFRSWLERAGPPQRFPFSLSLPLSLFLSLRCLVVNSWRGSPRHRSRDSRPASHEATAEVAGARCWREDWPSVDYSVDLESPSAGFAGGGGARCAVSRALSRPLGCDLLALASSGHRRLKTSLGRRRRSHMHHHVRGTCGHGWIACLIGGR